MSTGILPPPNPAYTPGLQLLGIYSASAIASLDLLTRNQGGLTGDLFQSDFDSYHFDFLNITTSAASTLGMQLAIAGIPDAAANYYTNQFAFSTAGSAAGGPGAGSSILIYPLNGRTFSLTANKAISGSFDIRSPLGANHKNIIGEFSGIDSVSPTAQKLSLDAMWLNTGSGNGARLIISSGTFSGTILVYGKAKSATIGIPLVPSVISGLNLLGTYTGIASASIDMVTRNAPNQSGALFATDYDDYEFRFINLTVSASVTVSMRMSSNGGVSYDSAANYGWVVYIGRAGAAAITGAEGGATGIQLQYQAWSNTANWPNTGHLNLYNPLSTSLYKTFEGKLYGYSGGFRSGHDQLGSYESLNAVNACQVLPASGTISGIIRVYGRGK